MKIPPAQPHPDWDQLLSCARADQPPPVDLPALLRAVRQEPYPPRADWAAEFLGLFSGMRTLAACAAGVGTLAVVTTWQAWSLLDSLPWAQLLDSATGGAL